MGLSAVHPVLNRVDLCLDMTLLLAPHNKHPIEEYSRAPASFYNASLAICSSFQLSLSTTLDGACQPPHKKQKLKQHLRTMPATTIKNCLKPFVIRGFAYAEEQDGIMRGQ